MKAKAILTFFYFQIAFVLFSQDSIRTYKSRYLNFLLNSTEQSQNHLFTVNHQFMKSPWGRTIGTQGTVSNFGINLARLFSNKIIIGLTADLKLLPGILPIEASSQFANDFNANFRETYDNPLDSNNAYIVKSTINSKDNFNGCNIIGNNIFNWGIMVSLFPQKYGGILLQAKYGGTDFQIHGRIYGNPYVNEGANDKAGMSLSGNWIYEITIKPLTFFRNTYMDSQNADSYNFGNSFVFSFYYERLNFSSAEFNGTKVRDMVSSQFMSDYGIDNRFGFKIGFAIY